LRLLGEIYGHRDASQTDQVEDYVRQALKVAQELKMRPLMARCHLGLGELYVQLDKSDKAQTELSTAIDLFRSMEMTYGLRQAETALAKCTSNP